MYSEGVTGVNKITDDFKLDTALCSDPEWAHKQDELFTSAEHWLNYHGIKTRTEYGNLLSTYNLFLEIGEYLQRSLTEENNE